MSDLLDDDALATPPVIEHRLRVLAAIRAVLALVVGGYLLTGGGHVVDAPNGSLGLATAGVVLAFSLSVPLWPPRTHRAALDVSLVVDTGAIGILLAITGGAASPFTPLVVVVVALPLIAFGGRTGLRAAVAATVALGWVWATSPSIVAQDSAAAVPPAALVADTRMLVTLLATWGAVGSVALLTRVVETDLRRAADDSDTLHRIGRALDAEEGPGGVAARLVTAVVEEFGGMAASVWLAGRTHEGLVLAARTGGGTRDLAEGLQVPRSGLVEDAMAQEDLVVGPATGVLARVHVEASVALIALRGDAPAPHGVLVVELPPRRREARRQLDTRAVQALEELGRDAGAVLDDAAAIERLQTLATTDAVTGMPNHRVLQERLRVELSRLSRRRSRGRPASLTLALFDLDHFKRVNDTHGHPTGDAVLAAVGEAVDHAARTADVVCRYGGEEFAVVLADTDLDEARAACERLRAVVSAVRVPAPDGSVVAITASFGAATITEDGMGRVELVAAADAALYEAKEAGRNRVVARDVTPSLARDEGSARV